MNTGPLCRTVCLFTPQLTLVPNYTAWWQRQRVCTTSQGRTRQCSGWDWTRAISNRQSHALTSAPPCHKKKPARFLILKIFSAFDLWRREQILPQQPSTMGLKHLHCSNFNHSAGRNVTSLVYWLPTCMGGREGTASVVTVVDRMRSGADKL